MKRNSLNPNHLAQVISHLVVECDDKPMRRKSTIIKDLMSAQEITSRKLSNIKKKSFSNVSKSLIRRISSSINLETQSSELFKNLKNQESSQINSKISSKTLRVPT
jgi:hypothetical protein